MRNLLLGLTPEIVLKFEIFPGESSSPHRGTETGCSNWLDFLTILDSRFFRFLSRIFFLYSPPLSIIFLWRFSIMSGWATHTSNCFKTYFAWFICPATNWRPCSLKEIGWLHLVCSYFWQLSLSSRFSETMILIWHHNTCIKLHFLDWHLFSHLIVGPYNTNVTALNRGTSIYLTNLFGMFDTSTQ